MSTMTAAQITDLHARRSVKGAGRAPMLHECLAAAREGRLWDVDTASAGHDCLWIADDAASALAEVSAAVSDDATVPARWTAEQVTLDVPASALEALRAEADERGRLAEAPAGDLGVGRSPADAEAAARRSASASGAAVLRALAEHLAALSVERPGDGGAAVRRIGRAAGAVCSATGEALVALAGPEDDAD